MDKRQTTLYRLAICAHCGKDLEHAATGRPRRFCSARCRVAHLRAMRQWARQAVDAIMAGEPEPALPGSNETRQARCNVSRVIRLEVGQ